MKNLENYGVQELNAREMNLTDGGLWTGIGVTIQHFANEFLEGFLSFGTGWIDHGDC